MSGTKWFCNACGKLFDTQDAAYWEGCGTWSVEVLGDSIERNEAGKVVKATLAGCKPDPCAGRTVDEWCATVAAGGARAEIERADRCCTKWIDSALVDAGR